MLIYLLRHAKTAYNAERRYQGILDIPISDEGRLQLRRADFDPAVVYTSTLQRTAQTARVLFPDAQLVPVNDLREMNFGAFQGRTYLEMEHDEAYCAWVDGGCTGRCPNGETQAEFSDRVCRAFAQLVDQALAAREDRLTIVAHGGTQMAAMERFAEPHRAYHEWCASNASGYVLDTARWNAKRKLDLVGEVSYARSGPVGRSFWDDLQSPAKKPPASQGFSTEGLAL